MHFCQDNPHYRTHIYTGWGSNFYYCSTSVRAELLALVSWCRLGLLIFPDGGNATNYKQIRKQEDKKLE
jgi:hypothetical protein